MVFEAQDRRRCAKAPKKARCTSNPMGASKVGRRRANARIFPADEDVGAPGTPTFEAPCPTRYLIPEHGTGIEVDLTALAADRGSGGWAIGNMDDLHVDWDIGA